MKRFDYAVIEYSGDIDSHQRVMNEYGKTGWELVTVILIQESLPAGLTVLYYFKQPIEQ
jgi:hypothetical protein